MRPFLFVPLTPCSEFDMQFWHFLRKIANFVFLCFFCTQRRNEFMGSTVHFSSTRLLLYELSLH